MDVVVPQCGQFSATVRLALHVNGRTYDLASIGPEDVVPRTPLELDACDADVVMDVDGDRFIWPVHLPRGAVPFDHAIATVSCGEMRCLPACG